MRTLVDNMNAVAGMRGGSFERLETGFWCTIHGGTYTLEATGKRELSSISATELCNGYTRSVEDVRLDSPVYYALARRMEDLKSNIEINELYFSLDFLHAPIIWEWMSYPPLSIIGS